MSNSRDGAQEYGTTARLFHWVTAGLVAVQVAAGVAMTSEAIPPINDALFILHKGMGCVFLVVMVARLLWKMTHPVTPLLPHAPTAQRRLAAITHGLLYALLIVLPVSGYIRTVGDGYPIEMLNALGIPPLVSDIPTIAHIMLVTHKIGGYVLIGLVTAHVAVAVHDRLEHAGALGRMWPPVRRRDRSASPRS